MFYKKLHWVVTFFTVFLIQSVFFIALVGNVALISVSFAVISALISSVLYFIVKKYTILPLMKYKVDNKIKNSNEELDLFNTSFNIGVNLLNKPVFNAIRSFIYMIVTCKDIFISSTTIIKSVLSLKKLNHQNIEYVFRNNIFYENQAMLYLFMTTIAITPGTICFDFNDDEKTVKVHFAFEKKIKEEIIIDLELLEEKLIKIFMTNKHK